MSAAMMRCGAALVLLLCGIALFSGANGQCVQNVNVNTAASFSSPEYPSTQPRFSCSTLRYTFTAPAGATLTMTCPAFNLQRMYFWPGSFRTISPPTVRYWGTSFPTVTTTTNSLTVEARSIWNWLFAWPTYRLRFSYLCTVRVNSPTPTPAPTPAPTPPPSGNTCQCGTRTVSDPVNRIVGGQPAAIGEFPYQARLSIFRGGRTFLCGGTLISNQWVVSAAHCGISTGDRVYLGDHNRFTTEANERQRTVSQVINHPSYNSFTFKYDIALVKLSSAITPNQYIFPACLPDPFTSQLFVGNQLEVTGWGTTSEGGSLPNILQKVTVDGIENGQCSGANPYYSNRVFAESICAMAPGKDSCQGDSGGPLVHHAGSPSRSYLIGVVSHGLGCARPTLPGVYTRVSNPGVLSWVKQRTGITCTAPSP